MMTMRSLNTSRKILQYLLSAEMRPDYELLFAALNKARADVHKTKYERAEFVRVIVAVNEKYQLELDKILGGRKLEISEFFHVMSARRDYLRRSFG